jgi:uncharacterized circularly permuted ATP-grasp superfamily protein
VLDSAALDRATNDGAYKRHVFKIVDGRGGVGIYIGPKMKAHEVQELKKKIRREPSRYVAEPFMSLSRLDGNIVDLRLLSVVDPEQVTVTPTPWGRGVPLEGDGKVNLSQRGREFAVVVVADPPVAQKGYRGAKRPRGIALRGPKRSRVRRG